MALKNLFDMVKADKYTADGREALIKAQEAETEDKVYQIGEISQKTGLQKTANGWKPPKETKFGKVKQNVEAKAKSMMEQHMADPDYKAEEKPAGKTSRADKEAAIRKDLGLTAGEDMSRFSDEQIESMYQKTQKTPEQQKADFDKSKIGQAVNKGRQEFAAEKTRQKKLASKTNAIGLPKGEPGPDRDDSPERAAYERELSRQQAQRAADDPRGFGYEEPPMEPAAAPKLNQVEKVDNTNRPYRIKGTQFYFETPEEAETAIVAGTRGERKTYAKPSNDSTINEIQNALGFKLDSEYAGKYSMDDFMKKTGKDEYGVKVWSFGTNSKGTLIDTIVEGYNKPNATIKKENGEWRLHYTDRDGRKMIVTPEGREWPTSDSAPRVLTGDTRIRVRKA